MSMLRLAMGTAHDDVAVPTYQSDSKAIRVAVISAKTSCWYRYEGIELLAVIFI